MSTVTLQRVKTLQIVDTAAFVGKSQRAEFGTPKKAGTSLGPVKELRRVRSSNYERKTGLFKLPFEVRQRIWSYALASPKKDNFRISSICFIHPDLQNAPPDIRDTAIYRHAKSELPPLFSVDKRLYNELLQSLLQITTFYILGPESAYLFANWVGLSNQFTWIRSLRVRRVITNREDIIDLIRRCRGLENLEINFECDEIESLGNGPICGLDAFPGDPIGRLADVISVCCNVKKLTLSCPCERADIKSKKHKNTEKGLVLLETWFNDRFESMGNGKIEIVHQHKRC